MSDIDRRRGKWVARWRDPDGRQRSRSFDRKLDAGRFLAAVQTEMDRGLYRDPRAGQITLAEYAKTWRAGLTTDAPSREATEIRWRVHILPALGAMPLAALAARPSLIQSFVAGLVRGDLSEGYARTILASLSGALSAAVTDRLIPSNPCASVKAPRGQARRVVPWTAAQVTAVQAKLPARYRAMADVGTGLGLRQGEAFGLAVPDVDFLRRVVHVRRQVRYVGGQVVFAAPKGSKERDVPLPESVSLRLAAHIAAHTPTSVTLPWREPGGRDERAILLFTTGRATACNRNTFNQAWRGALGAAGMPAERGNGFHALRHYFASVLLADGVDIRALSEYLGHHDPGFTLRTYTHLMPSAPDRMRAAVDRALGSAPQPAGASVR